MRKLAWLTLILLIPTVVGLPSAHADMLDLTTEGNWGTINGARFYQFNEIPTGTGRVNTFLRIQGTGVQQGFNTDGTPLYEDTMPAPWTHSIQLSEKVVPVATIDEIRYREFFLDINQDGQRILSLDNIQIALHDTGDLTGYIPTFSDPIYSLNPDNDVIDNWIKLDDELNTGSGHGDMLALIPDSLFNGEGKYIYLYAKFGVNSVADNGFEEFGYGSNGVPLIPEPATVLLLGLGALALLRRRRGGVT